jgi:hypothetical protein
MGEPTLFHGSKFIGLLKNHKDLNGRLHLLLETFLQMPPLETHLMMAIILKQLDPKLMTDPWDEFYYVGVNCFGIMTLITFRLLQAKQPCNFW